MPDPSEIPAWLMTVGASLATGAGAFVLALVSRGPAMEEAMTNRLKALMDAQAGHIDELTVEVHSLRGEVNGLRRALAARDRECDDCEKWPAIAKSFEGIAQT